MNKVIKKISFYIALLNVYSATGQTQLPNILMILVDDMGYGDLGSYNSKSKIPTPNMDRLAAEGIRFSNAYCSASVSTPTRYSLMTGQYPWRTSKKGGVLTNYQPSMIEKGRLTLPKMLQQAGYETAGFGKWHLGTRFQTTDGKNPVGYGKFADKNNGANLDFTKPVIGGPTEHGFDYWLGFSCASECWILKNDRIMGAFKHEFFTTPVVPQNDEFKRIQLVDYLPFITEQSINYIQAQSEKKNDKPFFLYFAPYAPHIPLMVSPEFVGKTKAGYYADYVHEIDHYIGQVLATLDRLGLADNTLVLLASDNGSQFISTSPEDDPTKVSNSPSGINREIRPNAHHPNFPFSGTKWSINEGGLRTPLIARWPGHFPKAKTSDQLIALIDIMPTIATLIGTTLPSNAAEDGVSLLPAFYGKKVKKGARESVVLQSNGGQFAIRWDKWKFIVERNNPEQKSKQELYDLSVDPGEKQNLITAEPEIATKMEEMLQKIRNQSK